MALINKIREHSGVAVSVIAIALILFIVGGDFLAGNQGGLFGKDNKVGEINGTSVDYKQYIERVDSERINYENQAGRSANPQELQQIREQVWEQFVNELAFKPEYEKAGFSVSTEELKELIQGAKNVHPYVRQQFTNPQTGQYDRARHMEFINAIATNQLPAEQKAAWDNFKKQLMEYRLGEKYNNLLAASSYITQAEAKKEYENQTEKVDARYLFVPFYSVNDSTIKVTDSQISDYYSKHKDEFVPYSSRTFDYVVFQVTPSKEDSIAMMTDLRELAKGLATAQDAAIFATANSDIKYRPLRGIGELPIEVVNVLGTAIPGQIVGPFKEGQAYSIYKYEGREVEKDSVRASHILVADKAKADQLIAQIKAGADFAQLARENSTDTGSKEKGGDLGYFGRGMMVAPFEAAAFANDGLVAEPVLSQFGYHIIKVTGSKTSNKYKVATISRILEAGEATRNEIYQKAENLRASVSSDADLKEAVKKDDKLVLLTAQRVGPTASSFNSLQDAREVVMWAFNDDTKMDKISDRVFEINDNFLIAAVTSGTDKDSPQMNDFKDDITARVKNELKGEQVKSKLANAKGDFETIASQYGAGALVESVTDINLATGMLNSAGIDPSAIGEMFGLAVGKRSQPFVGDNGVFIIEVSKHDKAPEIADYSQYKQSILARSVNSNIAALAGQAIRENSKIKDNRYKFF